MSNTLAYYNTSPITTVKSFTVKGTNFTQTIERFDKLVDRAIKEYSRDNSLMEQHALKKVNNCLNTNIYSYLETSGRQSSNPYLNIVHCLNTRAD